MKTTNLICNVCRVVETFEDSNPYNQGAAKVGWYNVVVSQLRPPAPVKPSTMAAAATSLAKHLAEADQDDAAKAFRQMADGMAESDMPAYAVPSHQSADLCPTCGPKLLSQILPHLTSEGFPAPIIGAM